MSGFNQIAVLVGILGVWVVLLRWRIGAPVVTAAAIKLTHILPMSLQTVIFGYWVLHLPEVAHHLPVIAVQIAFAYAFDFLLNWNLRRPYVPGFGPVPIVLSMNLFVWLQDYWFAGIAIACALVSKALLRVNGRHIFNPGVFGLSAVAVLCIGWPEIFRYEDVSHAFDEPPNMAILVFLLALIPQVRLGITPVAVGAALSMVGTMGLIYAITGYQGGPSPWWPAWLLATTLLAGDPATIPSSMIARLLFGLFLGVEFYFASRALLFWIGTDFFAKIIPIAVANLLVPTFERAGMRLSERWAGWPVRADNLAYLITWLLFFGLVLLASHGATALE